MSSKPPASRRTKGPGCCCCCCPVAPFAFFLLLFAFFFAFVFAFAFAFLLRFCVVLLLLAAFPLAWEATIGMLWWDRALLRWVGKLGTATWVAAGMMGASGEMR